MSTSSSSGPLFIIGTERSGSNLLRLILNAHSRIAIPHPPHLMKYLAPQAAGYGDLSQDAAMLRVIDDALTIIDAHIFPWDYPLDRLALLAAAPERSVFGVVAAIYEAVRAAEGKPRWGNKSTFMVHYVDEVRAVYPDARFILLVRDPRDVAVSARKSVFSPCHPLLNAELWDHQQQIGLRLLERLPPEAITLLRYEDLTAAPEDTLRALCTVLGEEFEPDMLRFFEGREAKTGAGLSRSWENTGRPVIRNNSQKFLKALSPAHILTIEAVCAETMAAFGYTPTRAPEELAAFRVTALGRLRVRLAEAGMQAGVEWRSLREDENHWRRWRRDLTARWIALRRGGA